MTATAANDLAGAVKRITNTCLLLLPFVAAAEVTVEVPQITATRAAAYIRGAEGVCVGTLTDLDAGDAHPYVNGVDVSSLDNSIVWADGTRVITLGREMGSDALRAETNYSLALAGDGCSVPETKFRTPGPHFGPQPARAVPFDASRYGNRGWPKIDWTAAGRNKLYTDSLTGLKLRILPATGDLGYKSTQGGLPFAAWAGGKEWTDAANVANGSNGSYGTVNGSTSPVDLFVPMNQSPWQYSSMTYPYPAGGLDNLGLLVWCSGGDSLPENRQFRVGVHDGVRYLLHQILTCPQGQVTKLESSSSDPDKPWPGEFEDGGFAGWTGEGSISRNMLPQDGNAVVSNGKLLTVRGMNGGNHLPVASGPGSRILLRGAGCPENDLCTLTNASGADTAVLGESVTDGTYAYVAYPWHLRVEKVTPTGSASIGLKWKAQGTGNITPTAGQPLQCAPHSVTEGAQNKVGSYCVVGGGLWYFIADDLSVTRLFSIFYMHPDKFESMPPEDRVPVSAQTPLSGIFPDPDTPKVFYHAAATSGAKRSIFKITYRGDFSNEYRPGLAIGGNNSFNGRTPPPQDELSWENIMPPSQNRDLAAQAAAITPNSPEFAGANWNGAVFDGVSGSKGFFHLIAGGAPQDGGPCLIAVVELTTGTVEKVFSTASGVEESSGWPATGRWGSCHSVQPSPVYRNTVGIAMNMLRVPGQYFGGPFEVTPTHVRMADGSWSTNTALAWPISAASNAYDKSCPTDIPEWLKEYGATGSQCVTVRIPHDPCLISPSPAALRSQTPCPSNPASQTMPQALRVGDRVYNEGVGESNGRPGNDNTTEYFRVLKITPQSDSGKEVVLARNAVWDYCCINDPVDSPRTTYCRQAPWQATHASGWTMRMAMGQTNSCGNNPMAFTFGLSGEVSYAGEPSASLGGHSTLGAWTDGQKLFAGFGNSRTLGNLSDLHTKSPPPASLVQAFPTFAGVSSTIGSNQVQAYYNRSHVSADAKNLEWTLDANALNSSGVGTSIGARRMTLANDIADVYETQVIGRIDYKRKPLIGWAGVNVLKDVSPMDLRSAPYYSLCHVYKEGDCGIGSVGSTWVKVARAYYLNGQCETGNYWANVPCVFSGEPVTGWVRRMASHIDDRRGALSQNLTMGLAGPGLPGVFWGASPTPRGTVGAVYSAGFLDGIRSSIVLFQMPEWNMTPDVRNDFGGADVKVDRRSGVTHARVAFGYNASLHCTERSEVCVTDEKARPFAFRDSDTLSPLSCENGCDIAIPAIAGRLLYYRIETYDGSTWSGDEIRTAVAQ